MNTLIKLKTFKKILTLVKSLTLVLLSSTRITLTHLTEVFVRIRHVKTC